MDLGILSQVVTTFQEIEVDLFFNLFPFAKTVFYLFAFFELAWTLVQWATRGQSEAWPGLLSSFLPLIFIQALLLGFPLFVGAIPRFFEDMALEASGFGSLSPTTLLGRGLALGVAVYSKLGALSPIWLPSGMLFRIFPTLLILVAFGFVTIKIVQIQVEQHLALGLGVLFLGFGSSRWTWGMAKGFFGWLVDLSLRVFLYLVLLGTTDILVEDWIRIVERSSAFNFLAMAKVLVSAFAWAYVMWSLPERIANKISSAWVAEIGNPYR